MKCFRPHKVKRDNQEMIVPCRYCIACKINRVTEWTIRIQAEITNTEKYASFLTLTYDDLSLPLSLEGNPTLHKPDVQRFHKRMRHHKYEFKFFLAGEYGEEGGRPHYHGIYIGNVLPKDREIIRFIWGNGNIWIAPLNEARIRYTVGYIFNNNWEFTNEFNIQKEFQLCSKNFGGNWIKENIEKIAEQGYINYKGNKISIPKYLKDKYEIKVSSEIEEYFRNVRRIKNSNMSLLELKQKDLVELKQKEIQHETKIGRKSKRL